jgi:5-methylcytosine-specific restriction enzyme subunit McrC
MDADRRATAAPILSEADIHARHRIMGHHTILETATIDVADGHKMLDRIRRPLLPDQSVAEASE